MSSANLSPLQLTGTTLQYGNATVPLKTARSFWVPDLAEPKINVYCHKGDYQTTFRLFLENAQNTNECIQTFLDKTEMRPSLLRIRRVIPFVSEDSKQSEASIEFQFMKQEASDGFERFCLPLFPEFTVTKGVKGDNLYFAKIQSKELGSKEEQIARINGVFKRITDRFDDSGINEALRSLYDSRFPSKSSPSGGSVCEADWVREHCRDYNVTSNAITEEFRITGNTTVVIPTTQEEIEHWLANPEAHRGQGEARYQHQLKTVLGLFLKEKPVNNEKLKPIMDAALSLPSFNLAEFMQNLNK